MKKNSQSGFAIVELVVGVILVAAIIAVGYYVWHNNNSSPSTTATTISSGYQSPSTSTPPAPQINNASDLNSAMTALNQTSIGSSGTDSSQLSNYSTGF